MQYNNPGVNSNSSVEDSSPFIRETILKLKKWLNKSLRIKMSDGRVLVGVFLCTDRDANIILGSCCEYLPEELDASDCPTCSDEPRMLGLVMIPGKHIVNIGMDNLDISVDRYSRHMYACDNII